MKQLYLFTGIFILCVLSISAWAAIQTALISTKENHIREYNRFYAPSLVKVYFEDEVEVISQDGDWFKVKFNEVEGWIHKSAIVKNKKQELRPVLLGAEMAPEEEDEVTLAGKGFNPEVEYALSQENPELNFAKVDEITSSEVDLAEVQAFIKEGGLNFPQ
ncbi:MAG: SH3 domain-containing protein [Desulfobacterales bacterium]|nr:SH3 domain-containing protein [Desulfobacterales bacterium]